MFKREKEKKTKINETRKKIKKNKRKIREITYSMQEHMNNNKDVFSLNALRVCLCVFKSNNGGFNTTLEEG